MKISKLFAVLSLAAIVALSGCGFLTTKTTTVSTNPVTGIMTTNTVIAVNQAVLDGECVVVTLVATDLATRFAKSPAAIQVVKDIEYGLNGIISGANTNSATQVIQLVGTKNLSVAEQQQIAQGIASLSKFEQGLIAKYGAMVGGQIALAQAKAINAGLAQAVPLQ